VKKKKDSKILNFLFGMQNPVKIIPGLALTIAIAIVGIQLTEWITVLFKLKQSPVSAIMMAIVLGIIVKNTIGVSRSFQPGVGFGLKKLLRLGIILMGIRLSIFSVLKIGALSVSIVVACILTGIFLTLFVTRKLGLPERLGTLIGVGTGICGASAIVATGPTIEAKEDEVAYAVGTITIFGIMAMFLYPYLSHLVLSLSHVEAGIFIGTSIHETAQVAGAGCSIVKQWAGYFLTVAMAGIGLGTDIKKLKKLGAKPFWVGLCAAISVGIISFLLIKIVSPFLAVIK
jgi:uncharacterized integral membrane protein (TIGR00698 family)